MINYNYRRFIAYAMQERPVKAKEHLFGITFRGKFFGFAITFFQGK
jgi:hypothetical protein